MPKPYQPVSCQLHSELELIIMHQQTVQLEIKSGTGTLSETVIPYDIISRTGMGEFLLAKNQHSQQMEIRLDQILDYTILPLP